VAGRKASLTAPVRKTRNRCELWDKIQHRTEKLCVPLRSTAGSGGQIYAAHEACKGLYDVTENNSRT